jgi:hypothetical protein
VIAAAVDEAHFRTALTKAGGERVTWRTALRGTD